jgi:hypothetical protein
LKVYAIDTAALSLKTRFNRFLLPANT